jgi:hypothetical protein
MHPQLSSHRVLTMEFIDGVQVGGVESGLVGMGGNLRVACRHQMGVAQHCTRQFSKPFVVCPFGLPNQRTVSLAAG